MSKFRKRFETLKLEWPTLITPALPFSPCTESNGFLYVSGQIPESGDDITAIGKVGAEYTLEEASKIAAECASNVVFWLDRHLNGDINRVVKIAKLTIFVNAAPGFTSITEVANGASERMNEIFGEGHAHARSAIGVAVLPINVPVEVEAIVEISS